MIPGMTRVVKSLLLATILLSCGCVSTLDLDSPHSITPYHIVDGGRIVVEVRVEDRGPFNFAMDTGASISIVFDKLSNLLELETDPRNSPVIHGLAASGKFPLVRINQLQVGQEIWANPRIASLPGDTAVSTRIDGILGIDFLSHYAVGFSTDDRVLHLYPPSFVRDRAYRGWADVPLQRVTIGDTAAALYFFDIKIGGKDMRALFDLGAGENLANWPAARALGFKPPNRRPDEQLSGAIESVPIAARFSVKEVKTASIRWQDEAFVVADLEIFQTLQQGDSPLVILGAGLFNKRDFLIDFQRGRVLVRIAGDDLDEANDRR